MRLETTEAGLACYETFDDHLLDLNEQIVFLLALMLYRQQTGLRVQVGGLWKVLADEYFPDRPRWNPAS